EHLVQMCQQGPGVTQHLLTSCGQGEAAGAVSDEQLCADLLLELADSGRDRRLCDVQLVGGLGHGGVGGSFHGGPHLGERDVGTSAHGAPPYRVGEYQHYSCAACFPGIVPTVYSSGAVSGRSARTGRARKYPTAPRMPSTARVPTVNSSNVAWLTPHV